MTVRRALANPEGSRPAIVVLTGPTALAPSMKRRGTPTRLGDPNSARVTFTATNDTTLGSMVRGIATYEFWNSIPGSSGPFSTVQQSYFWTEEVTW